MHMSKAAVALVALQCLSSVCERIDAFACTTLTASASLARCERSRCRATARSARTSSSRRVCSMNYDTEAYKGCFESAVQEWHSELTPTAGAIPTDLKGTLFSVGPGRFDVNGQRFKNPFEGDGMVSAVTFSSGGRAHFRNRMVRTKGLEREEKAGKPLHSTAALSWPAGWAAAFIERRRSTANRGVVYWGRLCVAMWEGGLPWKIDAKNLETYFQDDFKGYLRKGDKGGEAMGGRARYDAKNDRLIIYGHDGASKVCMREFNAQLQCGRIREEVLPVSSGFTVLADFAITDKYYVFSVAPMSLDKLPYTLGLKTLDETLTQLKEPTKLVLVPRSPDANQRAVVVPVDAHMCHSIANAYDDAASGSVIVDMVRMDPLSFSKAGATAGAMPGCGSDPEVAFEYASAVPARKLVRYTVSTSSSSSSSGSSSSSSAYKQQQLGSGRHCDYAGVAACVSGAAHRYVYCGVGADESGRPSPIQGISRLNTATGAESVWMAKPTEFMGAIAHIPCSISTSDTSDSTAVNGVNGSSSSSSSSNESSGYVVGILTDGAALTSELLIFKASDIAAGPICRCAIEGNIPPALSTWYSSGAAAGWDPDVLEKSFKLANLFKRKGWNEAKSEFSSLGMNMLD